MKPLDDTDHPPFSAPWQAQVFALTVHLNQQGAFSWREWGEAFSEQRRQAAAKGIADAPEQYYYDWIAALENILISTGNASADTLAALKQAWIDTYVRTPHGQPVNLER